MCLISDCRLIVQLIIWTRILVEVNIDLLLVNATSLLKLVLLLLIIVVIVLILLRIM